MKVTFTIWAIDGDRRKPVALEPSRVECIEHYQDAITDHERYHVQIAIWWGDELHNWIPPGTRVIMANRKEYLVQGTVAEVTSIVNAGLKS